MAQTLDQIIAGLSSVYDPQVQSVQAQQAALPQQQQNDQAALQGQQTQAFNSILQGARSRGTGVAFGGIPLGEQAQYNATTYQPALANLYSSYNAKGASLNDAINQINANRYKDAQGIYQFQVGQDQAAAQLAEQQREFDAQQKAAAAGGADYSFGGIGTGSGTPPVQAATDPYSKVDKKGAMTAINSLLKSNNVALINQTYNAIKKSASYGNLYDQYKMQLLNQAGSNSAYGNLLKQALSYKAPAASGKSSSTNQYGGSTAGLKVLGF
jgi:hypothetical protein